MNYVSMGQACKGLNSGSSATGVLELSGEPLIVINGVPNASPSNNIIPAIHDTASDAESKSNHGYGRLMEGRKVQKLFGKQYYAGTVVKFDVETNWYRVVYEDGDFEDMEWHELQEVLLPLDIATPLSEIVSKILGKAKSRSGADKAKSRKGSSKQIGGGKRQMVKLLCGVAETQSRGRRQIKPATSYGGIIPEKSKRGKPLAVSRKKIKGRRRKARRNMSEAKKIR